MKPHKRFLATGEFMLKPDFRVLVRRSSRPGQIPESGIPNSLLVNTWHGRLWLTDESGKPHEYKLVPVDGGEDE